MAVPELSDGLRQFLADSYGGTVRNTVFIPGETCAVCFTPVAGYSRCRPCEDHSGHPVADRVGAAVYAVEGEQSHHTMRLYKRLAAPDSDSVYLVSLLVWNALSTHENCLTRLAGEPVRYWATVPSLPPKADQEQHPLNAIVQNLAPGEELRLLAQPTQAPRTLGADHYQAARAIRGGHVLVIDDTWTTGAHAQSAALAVRGAGAGQVSVLNVARYLKPGYSITGQFLRRHPRRDFDAKGCCWTGGLCP